MAAIDDILLSLTSASDDVVLFGGAVAIALVAIVSVNWIIRQIRKASDDSFDEWVSENDADSFYDDYNFEDIDGISEIDYQLELLHEEDNEANSHLTEEEQEEMIETLMIEREELIREHIGV